MVFEPDASSAKFLGRNGRYTLRLSPAELDVLPSGGAAPLRIHLEGARRQTVLAGVDPLPGRSFYYLGADPRAWRSAVPQFAKVRYQSVYPGIDMLFFENGRQLEYDLILEPHADPGRVRMRFEGARRLAVESNGDLRIETASGVLWQKTPAIYQESPRGRRAVAGRYLVKGTRVRFAVAAYDRSQPLVIDPVLVYATYFGGANDDSPWAVAADTVGNLYVTGYTVSGDYPAIPTTPTNAPHGGEDVFVTKIDPTGHTVLYSVILGGSLDDEAYAIAADISGNAYVAGTTTSIDFPTLNANQAAKRGPWDAFVLKLDPLGNLLYSTYLGGSASQPCGCEPDNYAYGIAVDGLSNAYVTGQTWAADFPTTAVTSAHTPDMGEAFVTEFSAAGKLVFSTLIGGSNWDDGYAIVVGASGMLYVTGDTLSTNLPVTAGAFQKTNAGHGALNLGDAWVAKINPQAGAGGVLLALTYLGGSNDDDVYAINVDAAENVYLSGATLSTDFPVTTGAYQTKFGGGSSLGDAFLAKLNSSLSAAEYSTYFGGPGDEFASGLQVDSLGNVWVTGTTTSPTLTPASLGTNPKAIQPIFSPGTDGYLAELNASGSSVTYFSFLCGGGVTWGAAMAMDGAGNLYQAFATRSPGMPVVAPALQPTLAGGQDLFLQKINLAGSLPNPVSISSVNVSGGGPAIAQNAWIEIHGAGLAPASVSPGITWVNAPDFASGRMPTQLDGVSATVNGNPAYIYYISPSQINVLTPLDNSTGNVPVTVSTGGYTSPPVTVNLQPVAPSFLLLSPTEYIAALHLDYSLLGPASLSSAFTPAQPGETIILYGTGFGLPSTPLIAGSALQSGVLPALPTVTIGGLPATVVYAGVVSPGTYQFNVTVPLAAPNGDLPVVATYGGVSTSAGARITVQQ
jgi:uncharacterized protein (TIGR03437 family)